MTIRAVLLPVAFWVVSLVVLRLAVVPPEACVDATPAEMRASAAAAARWIATNQLDDGRYTYEYNRETGVTSPDYTIVRHAGRATLSMMPMTARAASSAAIA